MPSRSSGSPEALLTPLMFDPGTSWAYSIAIDWVGLMIEEITKYGNPTIKRIYGDWTRP